MIQHPKFFNDSEKILSQHEDIDLFYSLNKDVHDYLNCSSSNVSTPGVAIVKQFDEKQVNYHYKTYNSTDFEEWLSIYTTPIILDLSNDNLQMSLNNQVPTVILIVSNDSDINAAHDMLYEQATRLRRQVLFMISKNDSDLAEKIMEYYQVNRTHVPILLGLLVQSENNMTKYKFEGKELNKQNAEAWVQDLIDNKLEKFLQSEQIPSNPLDEGVQIVWKIFL